MRILTTKKFFLLFSVFLLFGIFLNASAANQSFSFASSTGLTLTGVEAGYSTNESSPEIIAGRVVELVLGWLGVVFLGFMIYAGIVWMTAQGNEQKVTKAKNMITESIIGLIIVAAAYAIAYYIVFYLSSNTMVQ